MINNTEQNNCDDHLNHYHVALNADSNYIIATYNKAQNVASCQLNVAQFYSIVFLKKKEAGGGHTT